MKRTMTALAAFRRVLTLSSKKYLLEDTRRLSMLPSLEPSLEIRKATREDKEAILNIDKDVYCGEDPLPWYYDRLISDPLFDAYIGTKDGKVILYQNGHIIDGGLAFVPRTARVSKEFRKTGVYYSFSVEVFKKIVHERGSKKIVFAVEDNNPHLKNDYVLSRYNQIMTLNVQRFLVKSPSDTIHNRESDDRLRIITEPSLRNIFNNEIMTDYLFPGGRIVVDWVPCRIMSSNLPFIMVPEAECVSDLVVSEDGICGLMTVGTYVAINIPGFCYNIALFGTDLGSLYRHLLFHLKRLANLRVTPTLLMVYTHPLVDRSSVEKLLETFGIYPYTNNMGHDVKSLVVMEHDLNICPL